jgi:hypothetical protein
MLPSPNTTKGKVLKRLKPSEVNTRLDEELRQSGFIKQEQELHFNSQYNNPGGLIFANANLYKKNKTTSIVFSIATDNPTHGKYTGPRHASVSSLPRCTEIFDHLKTDEFQSTIETAVTNGAKPPIRVYIPIASTYGGIITHEHFRGISLDVELVDGKVTVSNAYLINSRNKFFGRSCPDGVMEEIKARFPDCNCQSIFTGHQAALRGDNDSCGYRAASYGVQMAGGANPKELIDDVKCSTKLMAALSFLPNLVWTGLKAIASLFTRQQPQQPTIQPVPSSPRTLDDIVRTGKRTIPPPDIQPKKAHTEENNDEPELVEAPAHQQTEHRHTL